MLTWPHAEGDWAMVHAGLLPQWAEVIVVVLGWLAVLVLPVLSARKVWRRYARAPV